MSLSPDGARIAFGLSNGAAVSRAIVSAGEIDCGNARGNAVEGLALSNAGDLASAGSDGIWLNDVLISKLDATALTFDPAGKRLAAGLRDGSVRILDQSGKEMARLPYVSGKAVTGVAWGPDSLAAVSRDDGAVRVWDEHGRIKRTESQDDDLGIVAVAASPDGSLIATVGLGLENRTKVWAAGSNAPPLIIESPILEVYVSGVLFLDNSRLLISDSTGKVRLIPLDAKSRNEAAADFLRDHTCRRKQ
jgi:WD40 repeat protein